MEVEKPKGNVQYVGTSIPFAKEILECAGLKKDQILVDLGCGEGEVLIAGAKFFGAIGFGIEIEDFRIKKAKMKAAFHGVHDRLKFFKGSVLDENIWKSESKKFFVGNADIVFSFLYDQYNNYIEPKLLRVLKPGTRVISRLFTFKKMNLIYEGGTPDGKFYIYQI